MLTSLLINGMLAPPEDCCDMFAKHLNYKSISLHKNLNVLVVAGTNEVSNTPPGHILWDQFHFLRPENVNKVVAAVSLLDLLTLPNKGELGVVRWV